MTRFEDEFGTPGYRAFVTSDDEAHVGSFKDWCTAHGIGFSTGFDMDRPAVEDVWTEWLTDDGLIALLRGAWRQGGVR